jgi:phage-related protein
LGERFHTDTASSFACNYPTQTESGLQSQGYAGGRDRGRADLRGLGCLCSTRQRLSIFPHIDLKHHTPLCINIDTLVAMTPVLDLRFYRTPSGNEPVREWLRSLSREDRRIVGEDLKTIQLGWPLGMPLVRKLETGLWEARVSLDGRVARLIFTLDEDCMILLHGFIKKQRATPLPDLDLARARRYRLRGTLA